VLSQVVLSFGIPFALVPLVILTSRRDVMGHHVNQRRTAIANGACAAVIIALNVQAAMPAVLQAVRPPCRPYSRLLRLPARIGFYGHESPAFCTQA
jgi:hypothetical protein